MAEQKVNYNTQVFYSTSVLVQEFLAQHPDLSKAGLTDAALREYILSRELKKDK